MLPRELVMPGRYFYSSKKHIGPIAQDDSSV